MALVRTDVEYFMVDAIAPSYSNLTEDSHHHRQVGYNGYWDLEIELMQEPVASPIHVGTGDYEVDSIGYHQPFSRSKGELFLSGSGIKGVVRSYAEALSPSCELSRINRCEQQEMCPCCLLFGRASRGFSHKGRFSFGDSSLEQKAKTSIVQVPLRWSGRLTDGRRFYWHSDYQTWSNLKGFDCERMEVVLPPAKFITRLYFNNATGKELGLILLAMGAAPAYEFFLKLGGAKNRGLGSVKFRVVRQLLPGATAEAYGTYDLEVQSLSEEDKNSYVKDYLESLNRDQREVVSSNVEVFRTAYLEDDRIGQTFVPQRRR